MTPVSEPRIALVTGGSRGLGRATVKALAEHGVDVILTYRSNKAQADSSAAEVIRLGRKAAVLQLDTGDIATQSDFVDAVRRTLVENWHRESFNYLINNAGIGIDASFEQTTEKQFDDLLNVHFKGVFFLTQKLLPLISDGGRIVNISTGLTRFTLPGYAAYAAMKGAMEVLTRYLAKEVGPRGIAVNAVAPGALETDFAGGVVRDIPEANQSIAAGTAMGRVGLPEDIGPAIAMLVADENRWLTAQRIEVSGGMFL